MDDVLDELMALTGQTDPQKRVDGYWFEVAQLDASALVQWMLKNQLRLSTMTAIECPDGETDVIYHCVSAKIAINIRTITQQQHLPSLAPLLPSANWIEREIRDLYAVHFDGHPDPRPLVRPKEMPEGFFRKSIADTLMKKSEAK
jgi:Ni,Fe-hydrogenase III component G